MWTNICGGFTMCHLLSFVVFLMLWNKCTEAQILGGIQVGMWKTGPWRVCAGDRCGMEGIQLRSVTCEDPSSHINMPKSYCNQNKQPADSQTCFKVCKRHQHEFFWNVGTWQHCLEQNNHSSLMRKKCEPHDPPTGFQTRVVQCSNKTNISMVVEDYVCLRFWSRPPVNQSCLISCPQDCVTSEFGSWSSCSRTCNNGTQIRVRSVLRVSRYGGEICPPLTEARVCPNLPPCPEDEATHKLKFGEWTVCEKAKVDSRSWSRKDKRHRRGRIMRERIGLMKRNVTCLSEDGRSVRESVVVAKTCAIPLDCVTTSWSDWSECSSSCGGGGVQRRSRGIKQLPQGEGARSCYALEESRSCQVQLHSIGLCLSYIWVSGAWDECKTMLNSTCGGGTQSRDVYCVQHDKSLRQQAYANFTMGGNNGAETWALMRPVESSHCDQVIGPATFLTGQLGLHNRSGN